MLGDWRVERDRSRRFHIICSIAVLVPLSLSFEDAVTIARVKDLSHHNVTVTKHVPMVSNLMNDRRNRNNLNIVFGLGFYDVVC